MNVSPKTAFVDTATTYLNLDTAIPEEHENRNAVISSAVEAVNSGVFRIVVMGEIKKGKSSFINALLSKDLVPTDSDIATSTVYKILYGPKERITVFFDPPATDTDTEIPPLDIQTGQIADFGTETGNPDNSKRVSFIAIQTPSPLLKDGLVIVDTPGVGGLYKKHRYITFQYAPNADAVLFILDSVEAVISQDEINFLQELRKHTERIIFIQTKSDMADQSQVLAWKARNLEVLSNTLGIPSNLIPYFVVSSQLKAFAEETKVLDDLKASGFPDFLHFFNGVLIKERERLIVRRWLPSILSLVIRERELLSERWKIVQQSNSKNRPLLEKYAQDLRAAEEKFLAWQSETWPNLQREYRNAVANLDRTSLNALEDATLPDNTVRPILADLRSQQLTPDRLLAMEEEIRNEHASQCNSFVNDIINNYGSSFERIFKATETSTLVSMQTISVPSVQFESGERQDVDASGYRSMRETYMGTMFVQALGKKIAMLGGAGLGFFVAANFVSFGTASIVASLGALALVATEIWSYFRGYKQSRERQVSDILRSLEGAMTRTCQAANRAGRRSLNNLMAELKAAAEESFFLFQKQVRSDYDQRRKSLEMSRSQTVEEAKKSVELLTEKLKAIDAILQSLRQIEKTL
jgi:signal recognition particle receptor subunit beta